MTDHVQAAKARGEADRLAGRERNCFVPAMERVPAAKRLAAIMAYGEGFSGVTREPIVAIPTKPSAYDLNAVPVTLTLAEYANIIYRETGIDYPLDTLRPYYHTNTCAGAAVAQLEQTR